MEILYTPYLVGVDEKVIKAFINDVEWELEEVVASSNRLTVYVPLSDAREAMTDMGILFDNKRYMITSIIRSRSEAVATIEADEAQIELSDKNLKTYTLKAQSLAGSVSRALAGSKWTAGNVPYDSKTYHAEFENITSMQALSFLASQSERVITFDSLNRKVNLIPPEELSEATLTFRYKSNVEDISKTETQPTATVIHPKGKDGLTVTSVNGGLEYIEDFSWYTNLGMTLKDARARFTKEYVLDDARYIYPLNLFNEAKKQLALMSKPQLTYSIKASTVDMSKLRLKEQVYVVDEELGIKIKTVVMRLKRCRDATKNEIELNYLPESLSAFSMYSIGDSSRAENDEPANFIIKNEYDTTFLNNVPATLLTATVTVFTATFFEVGLKLELECTQAGILEGYFMMDGNQVGVTIKQSVQAGFYTIGIPFLITQVQEGTKYLDLYLKCTGAVKVFKEKAELYVRSKGAYGGVNNERPDQRVTDTVRLSTTPLVMADRGSVLFPVHFEMIIEDTVIFTGETPLAMTDKFGVSVETLNKTNKSAFAKVINYAGQPNIPAQQAVDDFMDILARENKVFKVVMVNGLWTLISTSGLLIYVDTTYNRITSEGALVTMDVVNGIVFHTENLTGIADMQELEWFTR